MSPVYWMLLGSVISLFAYIWGYILGRRDGLAESTYWQGMWRSQCTQNERIIKAWREEAD